MGIGVSVFLLAAGAVLTFAVNQETWESINIDTVGIIMMAAGALGLIMFLTVWGGRRQPYGRDVVVEERPVVERRVYE